MSNRRGATTKHAGALLDAARLAGNVRVIVVATVSDGQRLLPRGAPISQRSQLTLREQFFGADTVEAWHLKQLADVCGRASGVKPGAKPGSATASASATAAAVAEADESAAQALASGVGVGGE